MKRYEKPGCPGWDAVPCYKQRCLGFSKHCDNENRAVLITAESHSHGERCTHAWCHACNLVGFCFVFKFFGRKQVQIISKLAICLSRFC